MASELTAYEIKVKKAWQHRRKTLQLSVDQVVERYNRIRNAAKITTQTWRSWESTSASARFPRLGLFPMIARVLELSAPGELFPSNEPKKKKPAKTKIKT